MKTMDKVREEIAKIDKDRLHLVEAYLTSQVINRLCSTATTGFALEEAGLLSYPTLGEEHFDDLELIAKKILNMLSKVDSEESYAYHYGLSIDTKDLCNMHENTKPEPMGQCTCYPEV